MTVGEMIEKLKQFDLSLPVCISDWNEEWAPPTDSFSINLITKKKHLGKPSELMEHPFILIGSDCHYS